MPNIWYFYGMFNYLDAQGLTFMGNLVVKAQNGEIDLSTL
jgi:hypothetical protein